MASKPLLIEMVQTHSVQLTLTEHPNIVAHCDYQQSPTPHSESLHFPTHYSLRDSVSVTAFLKLITKCTLYVWPQEACTVCVW